MKSITLITKTKITSTKVSQKLIDSFVWKKKLIQNDEIELFIGRFPREFYIVFSDSCNMNEPTCFYDEADIKKIPFDNPIVNELYFRDNVVARYVVKIISQEYPELYIDNEFEEIMSASDYINS